MDFFTRLSLTQALLIVLIGMVATIGSALAFEALGYAPCALCLEQRKPYYIGIPFLVLGATAALGGWPTCIARAMMAIGFCCLIATGALGMYHSGVEWAIFEAPHSCGGAITGSSSNAGNLLESLSQSVPPSCAEAAGRFLGISFANANVIAAAFLALIAFRGLVNRPSFAAA